MIDSNREAFEKLPEIRKIMNEHGIHFMNHSGWYEARDFKDFEYEQYINGAWYAYQEQQKKIDMLKAKVQELWTELDDRQSKEHIIEKCESIIQELLKE